MTQDRGHTHHVDHETSHLLSQTGHLAQEIIDTLPDAQEVEKLITKTSELDASTVRNVRKRVSHPTAWISLGVSALIAALYLLI
ncbi:MAG: hypothetical protein EOP12_04835 [Pseudomonas sp.]|nr:MAG: hypothetical protein EOP12_04835 [Pseudomonas sp.]